MQYDLGDILKVMLNKFTFNLVFKKQTDIKPIISNIDNRVDAIYWQHFADDRSFAGDVKHKEIWTQGIKTGIEIGLYSASLEGQRVEMNTNTTDPKHIEFREKFYKLSDEYKMAIQYHYKLGMTIIDINK